MQLHMAGIDSSRPFIAVRIAVLTISDTRTAATDTSGQLLKERALSAGHDVVHTLIVQDDRGQIEAALRGFCADPGVDVVL
ncbi:MAG: molybdenum cofactor biosynthesis protein, partial [Pseudomonadota bacterium]